MIVTKKHSTKKKVRARCSNWEEATADALREWAMKDDSYLIEDFYSLRNIPPTTFYAGVKRNKYLKDAHEFALIRCGSRREHKCIKENLNINTVAAFALPHYFKRWRDQLEWRAELKNKEDQKDNKQKIVVIEKFADPPKEDLKSNTQD